MSNAPIPGNATETPVLSRDRLLSRCMGKQELADRLVQMLARGLPTDTQDLQSAVASDDLERIATVSHRLKGAAANLCAEPLSAAAAALEQAARNRNRDVLPTSWFSLQQQIDLVLQELAR